MPTKSKPRLAERLTQRFRPVTNPPVTNGALKSKPAANYLSISIPTLHRLIKRGLLRPNRATRHLTFARTELDRFIHDGMS
jgi:excisionase family DNA binding protein